MAGDGNVLVVKIESKLYVGNAFTTMRLLTICLKYPSWNHWDEFILIFINNNTGSLTLIIKDLFHTRNLSYPSTTINSKSIPNISLNSNCNKLSFLISQTSNASNFLRTFIFIQYSWQHLHRHGPVLKVCAFCTLFLVTFRYYTLFRISPKWFRFKETTFLQVSFYESKTTFIVRE